MSQPSAETENIYEQIHWSILSFPNHDTAWHAKKLTILPNDFDRIAKAITASPNTFWLLGPFIQNKDGWCIDFTKNKEPITHQHENIILRKRIATLESEMEKLRNVRRKRNLMDGWNGGGVVH